MPLCQAIKSNHEPCGKNASRRAGDSHPFDLHLCGTHKNTYNRTVELETAHVHYIPGRCFHTVTGRADGAQPLRVTTWCPHAAEGGISLCATHENRRVQLLQRQRERETNHMLVAALVGALLAEDPPVPWRRAVRILAVADGIYDNRYRAAFDYYHNPRTRQLEPNMPLWFFRAYWRWAATGQNGPEPVLEAAPPVVPRPAGLAAIARDNQNVHTRVVTEQTNTATDKLLAIKVPTEQQTEKTLALVWVGGLNIGYHAFLRVANDINRWFNTKDCRAVGDNMYRRLLRGLVALIASEKDDERKSEMYRRAWEECNEAVGMCCEGHISRLCNVLVGFDEAFQPPVPFGEILQSKMSAIAGLDVSDEEKRRQANAFFDEHKTPAEERVAWLEAF